jgi:hypothetical protein
MSLASQSSLSLSTLVLLATTRRQRAPGYMQRCQPLRAGRACLTRSTQRLFDCKALPCTAALGALEGTAALDSGSPSPWLD